MSYATYELQMDRIVGMTHSFGGIGSGNRASIAHAKQISYPKKAALQGLEKARFLASLGIKQALLPPQLRPSLTTLKQLGFSGTPVAILEAVKRDAPWLVPHVSSSASMWMANAATVSPSIDSVDRHVHFTPANLSHQLHRVIEATETQKVLQQIFSNPIFFTHHLPLPSTPLFSDEGAANHIRFCRYLGGRGVQLFVYGEEKKNPECLRPTQFTPRQTVEASQAIERLHQLYPGHSTFAQQNPQAIDTGVFHNDLIAVGHLNFLFIHEQAFLAQPAVLQELGKKIEKICDTSLILFEVSAQDLSLQEAVDSYIFNSQILSLPDGQMTLLAPSSCQESPRVMKLLDKLVTSKETPIHSVHFIDLDQSMANGGGPACLRLPLVLNEHELSHMHQGVFWSEALHQQLVAHIQDYYPDELLLTDLLHPDLYEKSRSSIEIITTLLGLKS